MNINEIKDGAKIVEFLEDEIERLPYHNKKGGDHIYWITNPWHHIVISVNPIGFDYSQEEWDEFLEWDRTRFFLRGLEARVSEKFPNWLAWTENGFFSVTPKNQ